MDSFNSLKGRNLTMLVDFYEMTMANGYLKNGMGDAIAYFDMFFRKVPDGGGYVIMAGVEQLCEYLKGLEFTPEDIEYLRGRGFSEEFLDYLADFKFSCDVYAVPEGTPIFPGEPIVTVKGPIMQAQFVETMVLLCINHQSLIATKANRIVRAAQGRPIMELTDEGRAFRYDPFTGCRGNLSPHPALRGHLPPWGKARLSINLTGRLRTFGGFVGNGLDRSVQSGQ